jgi:hypothetical protein
MNGKAMLERMMVTRKRWLAAVAIGCAVTGLSANSCLAQCVELSERTPQIVLQTFVTEPGSLLHQLRNNKEKLRGRLTAYLVTDPSVLPSVRVLIRDAQTADRPAIGEALRLAELRCIASQPEAARKIREFVRKLGDLTVLAGYSSAAADEPSAPAPRARSPGASTGLMTGEFNTDLKDPFAPIPVPQ